MTAKTALITGFAGQDGQYLSRLLSGRGYRILGVVRGHRLHPFSDRPTYGENIELLDWDVTDKEQLDRTLRDFRPDECYNLAAFASGGGMYDDPVAMGEVNGIAVAGILEAIRTGSPRTRLLQASSSEVFGHSQSSPQDESTPRNPRSPYGAAKLYADSMVRVYRERYGLFVCSAILYNHESPLRSLDFVSRKITRAAAAISLGLEDSLSLGSLDARRDWGYAGDYVEAMWRMLQARAASDYVIATGVSHSVREMCKYAFDHIGLDYRTYVRTDPSVFRQPEPVPLVGDAGKAQRDLGWVPGTDLKKLIEMMVDNDLAQLRASQDPIGASNESI